VFDGLVGVDGFPVRLSGFFYVSGTIFILHDGVRPISVYEPDIIPVQGAV